MKVREVVRGVVLRRPSRQVLLRVLVASSMLLGIALVKDDVEVVAATATQKTYSIFNGRARVSLPLSAAAPRKLTSKIYLVRPKNTALRFAAYVSKEPLGLDERKMSKSELGSSLQRLLEGQGYVVTSLTTRGQDFMVEFTTYASLPWQSVGTTPAQGVGKFTRTADQQLIGMVLLCEPGQWSSAAVAKYKQAVSKIKVTQR